MKKIIVYMLVLTMAAIGCGENNGNLSIGLQDQAGYSMQSGTVSRTAFQSSPDSFKVVIKKAEIRKTLNDTWHVVYEGSAQKDITANIDYLLQNYSVETGEYKGIKFTIEGGWVVSKANPFDATNTLYYTNDTVNDETHIFVTEDILTEIQIENPNLDTNFLKTLNAPFNVNDGNNFFLLLFDNSSVLTLYTNSSAVTNYDLDPPTLTITQQ